MRIIDSHCHLDESVFTDDLPAVVERMHHAEVTGVISVGVTPDHWALQVGVAELVRTIGVSVGLAFGIHPWWADRVPCEGGLKRLAQWLDTHRTETIAIGEIGLDCVSGMPSIDRQHALFNGQLDCALQWDLPVILHERKSADLLLKAIRLRPGLRGVVHGFVGSAQQAEQLITQGFFLGVGGAITHPRATRLRQVIKGLPLTALLLETDAPHQPGHAHRGARNEPAYIRESLTVLAALFELEEAVVADQLYRNTLALWGADWLNAA